MCFPEKQSDSLTKLELNARLWVSLTSTEETKTLTTLPPKYRVLLTHTGFLF